MERLDGSHLVGRLEAVGLCSLGLRLPSGVSVKLLRVMVRRLQSIDPGASSGQWHQADPPLVPCPSEEPEVALLAPGSPPVAGPNEKALPVVGEARRTPPFRRRSVYFEFAGLRMTAGMQLPINLFDEGEDKGWITHLGFEVIPFTLRYHRFYLEALRVGMGTIGFTYGTALGYAATLDKAGRHELRVGVHLTVFYLVIPTAGGLQLTYVARVSRFFAFEVGLMQYSFPTAIALTFGFRI